MTLFPGGPWRFEDRFGVPWILTRPRANDPRAEPSSPSLPVFSLVETLVFGTFSSSGAVDDRRASVVLRVYDELTNSRLSRDLPRPTNDPRRILRNFDRQLRHTLLQAITDGRLRVEKVTERPWPFPDAPDEPVAPASAALADEKTTFIAIRLLDQNANPVPNRRYRIALAGGQILSEGRLDDGGTARVDGLDPAQCIVTFPDMDAGTAGKGSASGAGDSPPPTSPSDLTWFAFQLAGSAASFTGIAYELTTPDGNVHSGTVDSTGLIRVDGVPPGLCKLRFPEKAAGDILPSTAS